MLTAWRDVIWSSRRGRWTSGNGDFGVVAFLGAEEDPDGDPVVEDVPVLLGRLVAARRSGRLGITKIPSPDDPALSLARLSSMQVET